MKQEAFLTSACSFLIGQNNAAWKRLPPAWLIHLSRVVSLDRWMINA